MRFQFICSSFLNTLIYLIFIVRIFLEIFFPPILILLWDYTSSFKDNGCNFSKICSALFQILCTTFVFFMTTITITSHVSVYVTCFFYLRILYLHNIFHITCGFLLCCARAVIHWMKFFFPHSYIQNITITWFFFIFGGDWSLFLALIILLAQIFFIFICFLIVRNHYINDFQFLPIHRSNYRLLFFQLTCPIFLLTCFVSSTTNLTSLVSNQTCFLILISLVIFLIRKN